MLSTVLLLIVAGEAALIPVKMAELLLAFAPAEMFFILLFVMVSEAEAEAPALIPVMLPEEVEEFCVMFWTKLLSSKTLDVTELPITIPYSEVVRAVEKLRTRTLLLAAPDPKLPTVLPRTVLGAVVALM
jgi:hypothetical protein